MARIWDKLSERDIEFATALVYADVPATVAFYRRVAGLACVVRR